LDQGNTLTKVIEANTNITNLQSNAFIFQASIGGTVALNLGSLRGVGVPGITVELEDTSGDVLATTTTDSHGYYSFNQLSGPAANPVNASGVSGTGTYQVVLSLPSWLQQTSRGPSSILISRGGINVTGVNYSIGINWNALSSTAGSQTAAAGLEKLASNGSGNGFQTSNTASNTAANAPVSAATTSTTNAQTSAAATTSATGSTASGLTPASLLSFLQSLHSGVGGSLYDSSSKTAGLSPPSSWSLDSAFEPDEFAKIADQLH
jgi:hypothetical protein